MTANNTILPPPPGLEDSEWELRQGRLHQDEDGVTMTNTIRVKTGEDGKPPRPPGTLLIAWSGWLLATLAAGVLAVSFAGQFAYIYAARRQVIAANIEAGMFDVGMIIFSLLALGLAVAGKPSRIVRACVIVCAAGSAVMNYAAADTASPRSVAAYVAPPLFLAVVVDRVVAVVRRHRLGADKGSPWKPLGALLADVTRLAGLILLYSLRLVLEWKVTWRGLRRMVLNAAPLPAEPAAPLPPGQAPAEGSKKAQLLTLYRDDPRHGDRALASKAASDLAPAAGLQPGTARTYINEYLASLNGQASLWAGPRCSA